MNLRELMTERMLYAVNEEILETVYGISLAELDTLTDLDFLELYEEVTVERE